MFDKLFRTVSWALEYGSMAMVEHDKGRVNAISGKRSKKLEIAGRIKPDQCFSAPQMGSTKKRPQISPDPLMRGWPQSKEIYFLSSPRVW